MNENRNRSKGKSNRRNQRGGSNKVTKMEKCNVYDDKLKSFRTSGSNDVAWYAQNAELLKSSSSLSFYTVVGDRNPLCSSGEAVPGVCTLRWSPNIDMNGPVQQAANSIYSYTVHANSRNYSYDPADQMMLILAGASLFSLVAHGIRAYGVMRRFNGQDKYTPNVLINAMGFNYGDLQSNLNKMWFDLNEIIARCSQIWIPNTMPLIQRWFWMNSNIYRDASSVKAQYYLFQPEICYYLDETTEETGTSLNTWRFPENGLTWGQYTERVRFFIDQLLNSEDRGIIFGDLLKAYGADKLYAINPISSDYTVEPVYDREVLTQIENATITGLTPSKIVQTANGAIWQRWTENTCANYTDSYLFRSNVDILNFHQLESPTPEQVMVATRLKCMGVASNIVSSPATAESKLELYPAVCGTETITAIMVWDYKYTSDGRTVNKGYLGPWQFGHGYLTFDSMCTLNAFDWLPWIHKVEKFDTTTIDTTGKAYFGKETNVFGEYDNFTYITSEELAKMHTAATYSLFGVPQM